MPSSTKSLVAFVLLPVLVLDALLLPLWLVLEYSADHVWLAVSQALISGLILPLYLAVLGSMHAWRGHDRRHAAYLLGLLLVGSLLGIFPDYVALGISARAFWHPDDGAMHLIGCFTGLALLVALLPVMLVLLVRALLSPRAAIQARTSHRNERPRLGPSS